MIKLRQCDPLSAFYQCLFCHCNQIPLQPSSVTRSFRGGTRTDTHTLTLLGTLHDLAGYTDSLGSLSSLHGSEKQP